MAFLCCPAKIDEQERVIKPYSWRGSEVRVDEKQWRPLEMQKGSKSYNWVNKKIDNASVRPQNCILHYFYLNNI